MMFTNVVAVACIGLVSVSATYYASPPPYYLNRFDGAGVYGAGLAGPAGRPVGVPFGYYGGALNNLAQRVPLPVPYPSPAPISSPALNQQALSQAIAYLNTQSQLSDSTLSASEPLVIYEDKNSVVAQGRRPSNVRSKIVAYPLKKFTSQNPGARVSGVLPGNLGYVLTVPQTKNNQAEKQQVLIQSPLGPAVSVAVGGQTPPNPNMSALQNLINMLRPAMNGANSFIVVLPPGQQNPFQTQTQFQSQSQNQGSKKPSEQYQPTFVPPGLDLELLSGEGYPLEVAPEEEVHTSEEQLPNSDTINTSLEEEPEYNNEIVSVVDESDAVLDGGTKRINKFVYQRRPGGLYLIPNKFRYSKAVSQDYSTHSSSSNTDKSQ